MHSLSNIRVRPDLLVTERKDRGARTWAIKDPVTLRYSLLRDEEFAVLEMLDGEATVEDVRQRFEKEYFPRRLSHHELLSFVAEMHRNSLVVARGRQSERLLARHDRRRSSQNWSTLLGLFSLRWKGIDPDGLLGWLHPRLAWVYSTPTIVMCVLLIASAISLAIVSARDFTPPDADFYALFSFQNSVLMLAVFVAVKIVHEVAHGLTCKHFGGEVRELGVTFFVCVPLLHCNVSDSWMFANRWQRIAVSAAGIYVEGVLASAAMWLWWLSEPGPVHAVCYAVMLICSLNTILINGNPLMRFDGYFVLSDLLGVPNLWSRSRAIVQQWILALCTGIEAGNTRALPERHRGGLAVYAAASMLYRFHVVLAILWLVHHFLEVYQVDALFPICVVIVLVGACWSLTVQLFRLTMNPAARAQLNRPRTTLTCVGLCGVIIAFFWLPLPQWVSAPAKIEAKNSQAVIATVSGQVLETATEGDVVTRGETIAVLANPATELAALEAEGEYREQARIVQDLVSRRSSNRDARHAIPTERAVLEDLRDRWQSLQEQATRLHVRAPASGRVIPAPQTPTTDSQRLGSWAGTPLQQENVGALLSAGTTLCSIGDPQAREAIVTLDSTQVELVRTGQTVRLQVDGHPGTTFTGKVIGVAREGRTIDAGELASDPELAELVRLRRDKETIYQARIAIDSDVLTTRRRAELLPNLHARVRIIVAAQPLATRTLRFLRNSFQPRT